MCLTCLSSTQKVKFVDALCFKDFYRSFLSGIPWAILCLCLSPCSPSGISQDPQQHWRDSCCPLCHVLLNSLRLNSSHLLLVWGSALSPPLLLTGLCLQSTPRTLLSLLSAATQVQMKLRGLETSPVTHMASSTSSSFRGSFCGGSHENSLHPTFTFPPLPLFNLS